MQNPFVNPIDSYKRDFNFIERYKEQTAIGLSISEGIDVEEARKFIDDVMGSDEFKEKHPAPNCKANIRGKNGDRTVKQGPFMAYLERIDKNQLGMSPTLAAYLNPNQSRSFIADDIEGEMKLRKTTKKEGIVAKQAGNKVLASLKNALQNAIKVGINSWSGASLSTGNPFTCKSTHSTLTSCCRITTATCTATAERFLAGKRYYFSPKVIFEDLLFTIQEMKSDEIASVVNKYNLHVPSVEEVMSVIERSSNYYFYDPDKLEPIREFVSKLSDVQRCAIVYTYDFYHLAMFNDSFARTMIDTLSTIEFDESLDSQLPADPFKVLNGDQTILVSNLLQDDLAGNPIYDVYKEDANVALRVKRVALNIINTVEYYKDYISAFLNNTSHPLHLGYQSEAVRLAVPLGDTDSSLISPKLLGDWYYGRCTFEKQQEPLQDVATYLITQVWEHMLGMFTAQMGVIPERRGLLIMKNEFKMPGLQMTPVAKTYHAYVKAQEGLVFEEGSAYERKGARFHASKHNVGLIKPLHELMDSNLVKLSRGEEIDRSQLINAIYQLEQDIYNSVDLPNNPYFLTEKVKPADEYANPNSSNYAHYPLWQKVFAQKYGNAPDPMYLAAKVPVTLENKTAIKEWVASLPPSMQAGWELWRAELGKKGDKFSNIKVPLEYLRHHALPEEMKPIINYRRIIGDILDPYFLYLSSMGIHLDYKDNTKTISDLIDIADDE